MKNVEAENWIHILNSRMNKHAKDIDALLLAPLDGPILQTALSHVEVIEELTFLLRYALNRKEDLLKEAQP